MTESLTSSSGYSAPERSSKNLNSSPSPEYLLHGETTGFTDLPTEQSKKQSYRLHIPHPSLSKANYQMPILKRILISGVILCLISCSSASKSEQITLVKQNLDKVRIGMTKTEVEEFLGKPVREAQFDIKSSGPACSSPCNIEMWLMSSDGKDYKGWPHIVFDTKSGKVIRVFKNEYDLYF